MRVWVCQQAERAEEQTETKMKNKLYVWVRKCEPSQAAYHSTTCKSVYWTVKNKKNNNNKKNKTKNNYLPTSPVYVHRTSKLCGYLASCGAWSAWTIFVCWSVCAWRACAAPWRELRAASSRRARRCLRLCPSRRRQREGALMWRWRPCAAPPRRCNPFPGCPRCAGLPKQSQADWVIPVKTAPPCGSKLTFSYKLTALNGQDSTRQYLVDTNKK